MARIFYPGRPRFSFGDYETLCIKGTEDHGEQSKCYDYMYTLTHRGVNICDGYGVAVFCLNFDRNMSPDGSNLESVSVPIIYLSLEYRQ